jgi:phosphatidate cytidylyltransferase
VTAHPAPKDVRPDSVGDNLPVRLASSFVLAPAALLTAWFGGLVFVAFWGAAAIIVAWEWSKLVARARNRAGWLAAGGLYALATLVAPLLLRADPVYGLEAVLFLFAIVWLTDVLGYVVGRVVGGPRLWPAISPNKTWSGALGGIFGALAAGLAVAAYDALASVPVAIVAMILSMVAQAGDLFESAVKRRFGVKDTSHLIPGHGGLMDRLDGFIAAALVASVIGLLRAGPDAVARGLLVW